MKRARVLLLIIISASVFFSSCSDEQNPMAPDLDLEPSLSILGDPSTERISQLIEALYPKPFLYAAARVRWHMVQRLVDRNRTRAAQRQARILANAAVFYSYLGVLLDPADPDLPETTEEAVVEMVTRLFVYTGMEASGAKEEFPDFFEGVFGDEDSGVGVIDPESPDTTVVTTTNNWAAIVVPPGATEEPVYLTIDLLDEETCEGTGGLVTALGCWKIESYPEGELNEEVRIEICVADTDPSMAQEDWDLLLVHEKDTETGQITALPYVEPQTIDCTTFDPTVPAPAPSQSGFGPVASVVRSLGTGVAEFFLPEPVSAHPPMFGRPPRGIGGLRTDFSEFFGAVPEAAKPDLISWWTGDGNLLDMYEANPGTPQGDVGFVPGVSGDAFSFDGDGDGVLIEPLSEEVRSLQELTLSTWVKLDPAGPPDQIQRFVTLGDGKAVLRQEGSGQSNRELHFFMDFEGLGLQHIWVNNAFRTGCYHHLVGTYDGLDMRAYLDGVEVGVLPVAGGEVAYSADFAKLGASGGPGSPGEVMTGSLDEVMIFDRALDGLEIAEMHQAGGPARCQPASADHSVLSIDTPAIQVGETTQVTLQARDASGNDITGGGASVTFHPYHGALTGYVNLGDVTDHGDGTYTASVEGLASGLGFLIGGSIDGVEVTTGNAQITVNSATLSALEAEAMIAGSFNDWWRANHSYYGVAPMLSVAADEHTSSWRNFGMEHASTEPRQAWDNTTGFLYESASRGTWLYCYRSLLSIRDALIAIEAQNLQIGANGEDTHRALTFAKFMQGLSLGTLALVYDQAFVIDEDTDLGTAALVPFDAVMVQALAKLDEAITMANETSFASPTPSDWVNGNLIDNDLLVALSNSYKARFRAQLPRTPQDRAGVDWFKVLNEVNQGITTDFSVLGDWDLWWDALKTYASGGSGTTQNGLTSYQNWGRLDVRHLGPADIGGNYQGWLALPLAQRNEILIDTPDRRITGPNGDGDGLYVKYIGPATFRQDRGLYHFSYYGDSRYDALVDAGNIGPMIEMSLTEMEYLRAEAQYRRGNYPPAVSVVNVTRTINGQLPEIDWQDGPTGADCVPRKDSGLCGDFWDAFKYEKRWEVYHTGLGIAFFDDRGWDDLVDDTFRHLPIPGQELNILGLPYYTFGGPSSVWPDMVAGRPSGPMKVDPEALGSYWAGLRARLADLEAQVGPGGIVIQH